MTINTKEIREMLKVNRESENGVSIRFALDLCDRIDELESAESRNEYVNELKAKITAMEDHIRDLEDTLEHKRRLTRALDVELNGEDGAAKQASLCDLIGQIKQHKFDRLQEKLNVAEEGLHALTIPLGYDLHDAATKGFRDTARIYLAKIRGEKGEE